jgi:cytoskeletal protein RodZ
MRGARHLAALLIVLGAVAMMIPAIAFAGGSAGNNQYTNPFGNTSPSSPPATSSTASAPPSTTPSQSTSPASTSPSESTTPQATTTDPTATAAAAGAGGSTTTTSGPSLPRTGYLDWEAAGFGIVLVAGGVLIRRRTRRA